MIDIKKAYEEFCKSRGIQWCSVHSVSSYNSTTLFCPAGMQQYENMFTDLNVIDTTIANIQPCIRIKDMEEMGDGIHLLYFNMLGLFSFRGMSVPATIDFWMEFLFELGVKVSQITIHPDKFDEWKLYYSNYKVNLQIDEGCIWGNGSGLEGYCTEFYVNDIEIGNIVNINGDCIDVGFGYERLNSIVNKMSKETKVRILQNAIIAIIDSGCSPGPKLQGYVLRKLLRIFAKEGGKLDHKFFYNEIKRQERLVRLYNRLKTKHKDKSKAWWYDTHGINLDELT